MANLTNELKAKLLAAQSAEEVAALLKDGGVDEPTAERIWAELTHKWEEDGKELSLDELAAVSGGDDRDYLKYGCAATVEPSSDCYGTDYCSLWPVTYIHYPTQHICPNCGRNLCSWETESSFWSETYFYFVCSGCGRYYQWKNGSVFEELIPGKDGSW